MLYSVLIQKEFCFFGSLNNDLHNLQMTLNASVGVIIDFPRLNTEGVTQKPLTRIILICKNLNLFQKNIIRPKIFIIKKIKVYEKFAATICNFKTLH